MVKNIDQLKNLRDTTKAGVMDCRQALKEANGDFDKAVDLLRKKGVAIASKKASRVTKEGIVESYVHLGGKIGVLVEINCETDFVARNEEFKKFAKDVAMQIAATYPQYISKEDVPEEVVKKESGIVKIEDFYKEACLLEQPFIKDPAINIKDYLTSLIAKTGENALIKRFSRFSVKDGSGIFAAAKEKA